MIRTILFSITFLVLIPNIAPAALTARARMYSVSIRAPQASNAYGDLLKISSTGMPDGDYELYPSQQSDIEIVLPGTSAYSSRVWFWDNYYRYWSSGTISLDLPALADANNNKFPDFMEVSRGLSSAISYGSYSYYDPQYMDFFYGNITATWNRAAGQKRGTCVLALSDSYWGTFYGSFEVLEYGGSLVYTPGATNVTGILTLTQTGSNATFQGSVQFSKSDTNRFDSLIVQGGILTNEYFQPISFTNHYFFRDASWPTNYAGYIQFDNDNDMYTFCPWSLWALSIDDTNDVNRNGIPDFSDDPQVAPPRRPSLSLRTTRTNLLLTIGGDVGHVHELQQTPSLAPVSWSNVVSLTLTNDPVIIPLPAPSGGRSFWRVLAQ